MITKKQYKIGFQKASSDVVDLLDDIKKKIMREYGKCESPCKGCYTCGMWRWYDKLEKKYLNMPEGKK